MHTAYRLPGVLASWFSIVEVRDAEPMAGEMFRQSFNDYPPDVPHHYVARVSLDGEQRTIGYVHMRPLEDMFLCGGMCMDDRVFRRLPHERRAALKAVGGVAEQRNQLFGRFPVVAEHVPRQRPDVGGLRHRRRRA